MNKYDKEDTVDGNVFWQGCLLGTAIVLLALIGFICFCTWIFEKIS